MGDDTKMPRRSTYQLLGKIPNHPGLYRHTVNDTYYGIKKISGKRKEHSLDTTDRKVAEKRLKEWLASLTKVDSEVEKTTLEQLLLRFQKTRQGKKKKTRDVETWLSNKLRKNWAHGLDIQVSRIRPSMLDEFLAKIEPGLKNTSYNRVGLFLKQLFDLAVADRIIAESPVDRIQKGWKKPQKPKRYVPTNEQFRALVSDIRAQQFNADAEDSGDFVEFLGLAGLGEAEASSIEWDDVDWQQGRLSVRRHKTQELFFPPIYPDLKPFLKRLRAKLPEQVPSHTRIFQMRSARKAISHASKRLQFPNFTPRSIRAFLIRQLWQAKVDIKLIAQWQGHTDGGKLILTTYTEVFGTNDSAYVQGELAKVSNVPPVEKQITISATEHQKLLSELAKLRSQLASMPIETREAAMAGIVKE
jgi:integrase